MNVYFYKISKDAYCNIMFQYIDFLNVLIDHTKKVQRASIDVWMQQNFTEYDYIYVQTYI